MGEVISHIVITIPFRQPLLLWGTYLKTLMNGDDGKVRVDFYYLRPTILVLNEYRMILLLRTGHELQINYYNVNTIIQLM